MNINKQHTACTLLFPIVHVVLQTLPDYLNLSNWVIAMRTNEFLALLVLILGYLYLAETPQRVDGMNPHTLPARESAQQVKLFLKFNKVIRY